MTRSALWFVCVAWVAGIVVPTASAQETSSNAAATGQQATPPAEGPPSEAMANALRLYQTERYREAAVQFQRVVDNETGDAPANVQKAQFFLAKCLYHLEYYQSALSIFDEISQAGAAHIHFNDTLEWLAQLASQLPESAGIIEKVGRYGVDQLERFNTPESRDLYYQLLYLEGRYQYQQGEFQQAADLFGRVVPTAKPYVDAKFFEGITNVRMRRARPAIAAFRAIIDGLDQGRISYVEDEDRMRNLAWISLARVYYTAANRVDPETGDRNVDGRILGQAVEAWNKVDQSSEYWLDALFESSWAFFLADEYSRALGNIHTLNSPYFRSAYYPEGTVLKAVTFFVNCQVDNAEAMIQLYHQKYDPVRADLDAVLARYEDNTQFFEFLKQVRAGNADLPEDIRGLVSTALSDRTVLRHLEYVDDLEAEERRFNAEPDEFKNSPVGGRILQDLALAKSYAIDQAGDLARGRYNRLISELQELSNQVDIVELEIATYQRGQLDQQLEEQMTAAAASRGGNVVVDEEHQRWPFDGEYWRDELGFYRQQVTNQCGR